MSFDNVNVVADELFRSLFFKISKYFSNISERKRFDSVQLLDSKCHEVNFRHDGSCIDSSGWVKNEKAIINLEKKMISVFNALQQLHLIMRKFNCI